MKTWFLLPPYTGDDLTWLDSANKMDDVHVEVEEPYNYPDSGWCDMATGQQLITDQHRIYILTFGDKGEMWTLLKYQDRVELR